MHWLSLQEPNICSRRLFRRLFRFVSAHCDFVPRMQGDLQSGFVYGQVKHHRQRLDLLMRGLAKSTDIIITAWHSLLI